MEQIINNYKYEHFHEILKSVCKNEHKIKIIERNQQLDIATKGKTLYVKKTIDIKIKVDDLISLIIKLIERNRKLQLSGEDTSYIASFIYKKYLNDYLEDHFNPNNKENCNNTLQRFEFLINKYK